MNPSLVKFGRLALTASLATAAVLLQPLIPIEQNSVASAAGCLKREDVDDWTPPATADGATMAWYARDLWAYDYASGGFSAQVMWVGTDNQSASDTWVEAGLTSGWQGTANYYFYTANGVYPSYYAETAFKVGPQPVLGTGYGFKIYDKKDGTNYRLEIADTAMIHSYNWPNHHPNTVEVAGGSEITYSCPYSYVDRTYVYRNRYRLKSNGTYYDTTSGSLLSTDTPLDIAWCSSPVTFRYWFRSNIPTSSCS